MQTIHVKYVAFLLTNNYRPVSLRVNYHTMAPWFDDREIHYTSHMLIQLNLVIVRQRTFQQLMFIYIHLTMLSTTLVHFIASRLY